MTQAQFGTTGKATRQELIGCGLRSLFLESSFGNQGKQNVGYATVLAPVLRRLRPDMGKDERLRLLRPFSTNPFLAGVVLGAAVAFEEEAARDGQADPDQDGLVACMASAAGAKGDQLFWNTWLQFSALAAFFATWRFQAAWGPFLLPVLFSLAALPVRFRGIFWGYRNGVAAGSGRLNASILILRRRLQTGLLFLEGLLTALVMASLPATGAATAPRTLFFASAAFLALLLGAALHRRSPRTLALIYLMEAGAMYFILSRL